MAKLKAAEPSLKKRAGTGLKRIIKAGRMMGEAVEEGTPQIAQTGRTARERSLNQEREKQRRRAEEEKRQEGLRLVREEGLKKVQRAEEEMDRARAISDWIEKIESCPVFEPSEEDFKDPLKYIDKIASEVAPKFGICKVIPPGSYVNSVFMGRNLFRDPTFKMEVRKQPLRMVDWDQEEGASKDVNFNKDTRLWTVRQLEEWANNFVAENYDGSSSALQLRIIEREFWKEFLLRRNKTVRYASDVPGTVFDPWEDLGRSRWNLGKLPTLPDSVLRIVETAIPGVTLPMLYVGMLFSMFAWHVEDQYLYSINYHHLGAPKTWYGVPGSAARDFERVAQEKVFNLPATPEGLARTLKLLIGKTIMFPPGLLVDAGVPVCRAVQQPGEFVITFPRSYHAGFSNGFNCGEAVNFAMPDWFPFGAACTRRYRLLRQVQVVAYDELLCKEARQLYKRRAAHAAHSSVHQPTAMELHTMVEFVRLLRWQHWQRWCLQQRGVPAQPILLLKSPAIECTLCHHKNYLAYVVCSCHGGPICLNHPDELAACRCQPQPPAPARKVHYLKKLPKLEAIAAAFEREPAVVAQLARAAYEEQHNPELRDEWRLGQRWEDVIGDGIPRSTGAGYQRWAPIPGYSYGDGLGGKAMQPGTPSQQSGEGHSEGASQGSDALSPSSEQAQDMGQAAKKAAQPCLAIQTVPKLAPWSPAQHAPPRPQPATPPQPAPISAPQSPPEENGCPPLQAVAELPAQQEDHEPHVVRTESGISEHGVQPSEGAQGKEAVNNAQGMLTDISEAEGVDVEVAPAGSGGSAFVVEEEGSVAGESEEGGQAQGNTLGVVDARAGVQLEPLTAAVESGVGTLSNGFAASAFAPAGKAAFKDGGESTLEGAREPSIASPSDRDAVEPAGAGQVDAGSHEAPSIDGQPIGEQQPLAPADNDEKVGTEVEPGEEGGREGLDGGGVKAPSSGLQMEESDGAANGTEGALVGVAAYGLADLVNTLGETGGFQEERGNHGDRQVGSTSGQHDEGGSNGAMLPEAGKEGEGASGQQVEAQQGPEGCSLAGASDGVTLDTGSMDGPSGERTRQGSGLVGVGALSGVLSYLGSRFGSPFAWRHDPPVADQLLQSESSAAAEQGAGASVMTGGGSEDKAGMPVDPRSVNGMCNSAQAPLDRYAAQCNIGLGEQQGQPLEQTPQSGATKPHETEGLGRGDAWATPDAGRGLVQKRTCEGSPPKVPFAAVVAGAARTARGAPREQGGATLKRKVQEWERDFDLKRSKVFEEEGAGQRRQGPREGGHSRDASVPPGTSPQKRKRTQLGAVVSSGCTNHHGENQQSTVGWRAGANGARTGQRHLDLNAMPENVQA